MARTILFLKFSYFQKDIMNYVKNYLDLTQFELDGLVAAVLLYQDSKNKSKVFDYERIINMRYELTGKRDYRKYHGITIYDKLVKEGYFEIVGNKFQRKKTKMELPIYRINKEKMIYFLSVLNNFIETDLKKLWTINELPARKMARNPKIKKNVLQHKNHIKSLIKI